MNNIQQIVNKKSVTLPIFCVLHFITLLKSKGCSKMIFKCNSTHFFYCYTPIVINQELKYRCNTVTVDFPIFAYIIHKKNKYIYICTNIACNRNFTVTVLHFPLQCMQSNEIKEVSSVTLLYNLLLHLLLHL